MFNFRKHAELKITLLSIGVAMVGAALASSSNHIVETLGVVMILASLLVLWVTWFF
jgi:hypothetical protein